MKQRPRGKNEEVKKEKKEKKNSASEIKEGKKLKNIIHKTTHGFMK